MWLIQSHNTPCQYFTLLGNHFRAAAVETENVIFAMFGKAIVLTHLPIRCYLRRQQHCLHMLRGIDLSCSVHNHFFPTACYT